MTVENEVAALTKSVDALTSAVNVRRSSLDASVSSASSSATTASTHKDATNTLKTETSSIKDAAVTAANSADTDAASAYQNLTAIAESKAVTAEDVFVYDTSKDSDGGAWRNRTQGTSWYNEALNTSTRGATKKFPAVAVIVAEEDIVTVYDADNPNMPMWMVFTGATNGLSDSGYLYADGNRDVTSIVARDGVMYVGTKQVGGVGVGMHSWHFIQDTAFNRTSSSLRQHALVMAQRNSSVNNANQGYVIDNDGQPIVHNTVNDIAVTVLPNAPIDPDTGLPVPTIAVATDGGVSVIKDDGSVVDITGHVSAPKIIQFNNNNEIVTQENYHERLVAFPIPEEDVSTNNVIGARKYERHGNDGVRLSHWNVWNSIVGCETNKIALGCSKGLNQLHENPNDKHTGMVNYITSDYNTGWLLGHTALATLMDTAVETVSPTELANTAGSSGNTGGSTWTIVDTQTVSATSSTNSVGYFNRIVTLEVGKQYTATLTVSNYSGTGNMGVGSGSGIGTTVRRDTNGSTTHTFTATGDSLSFFVRNTNSGTMHLSVQELEPDRTVNANGLNIVGNVTKASVATGAELVGYGGFSGSNYLQQPYNSDLNFTDTAFFSVWVKDMLSGGFNIFDLGERYTDHSYGLYVDGGNDIRFYYSVDGTTDKRIEIPDGSLKCSNGWHLISVAIDSGSVRMYIDGKLEQTGTLDGNFFSQATAQNGLVVGTGSIGIGFNYGDMKLALLRISATAPTAEQIAKIYRDEKPLFQEGAKCTLYGNSDVVNAIDYDDATGTLYVGTPNSNGTGGLSEFKGLQRTGLNSNTQSVGVAVSAQGGLVVSE